MYVTFYGGKDSMTGWREIVLASTGKVCLPIEPLKDDLVGRHQFVALIDEADCTKLMKHWYEVAPDDNEYKFAWNCRVTFSKSTDKKRKT